MEVAPIFVGIDVSKARLDIALRPSGARESIPNEEASILALVERLRAIQLTLIVLEATGGVERPVVHALAGAELPVDRKSTRLNSSHGYISYAVFCLKKKKTHPLIDTNTATLSSIDYHL